MLNKTLKDLQFDYIDTYLIHFVYGGYDSATNTYKGRPIHKIWAEFESLVDAGRIKNLGVSNFNCQAILDLLSYAKHKPVLNQIELHPCLQQKEFVEFMKKQNILPQAWSPFTLGSYPLVPKVQFNVFEEPLLKELSAKYNKSIGQIILNFELSVGMAVVPKTSNPNRLKENIASLEFAIEASDIEKLRQLNQNKRALDFKFAEKTGYLPYFD